MEILSYRDEVKCKTILKIVVDDDLEDIEEAKRLIAEDTREQLRKYWKIEQELGIPLEVLFKALKDGIYIIDACEIIRLNHTEISLHHNGVQWLWETPYGAKTFTHHKITWSLTREELGNAKD